ncbi:MAG: hypothetical protein HEQ23_12405 [Tepidisphaera sp.]
MNNATLVATDRNHIRIDQGGTGRPRVWTTVSFVVATLAAIVAWSAVAVLSMVFVPKALEPLQDFAVTGSTLTRLSGSISAWMLGLNAGQALPGWTIALSVGMLAFLGLGFLSARHRGIAAAGAFVLTLIGVLLAIVLFLGMYDGVSQLTTSLEAGPSR